MLNRGPDQGAMTLEEALAAVEWQFDRGQRDLLDYLRTHEPADEPAWLRIQCKPETWRVIYEAAEGNA